MRTDRLTLRPWKLDEAAGLFDIVRRAEVTAWLGDPDPWTLDQTRAFIAKYVDLPVRPEQVELPLKLAIVPDGREPVGLVLADYFPGGTEAEIGWFLHPDAAGNGWATEAGQAIHDTVVAAGVRRVWAGMWPHNIGSAAVCRRIGMVELGVVDDPWYGTIEYPLSRFFCTWNAGEEHPLSVLRDLNEQVVRRPASSPPPIGANGLRYPGDP